MKSLPSSMQQLIRLLQLETLYKTQLLALDSLTALICAPLAGSKTRRFTEWMEGCVWIDGSQIMQICDGFSLQPLDKGAFKEKNKN